MKNGLKKVVGKAKLNFEELNTVIVEIEKSVNSKDLFTVGILMKRISSTRIS